MRIKSSAWGGGGGGNKCFFLSDFWDQEILPIEVISEIYMFCNSHLLHFPELDIK
jgi:hypothetical protein